METSHTASLHQLLEAAGRQANMLVGLVKDRFEHVYTTVVAPRVRSSARVQGLHAKKHALFEQATFVKVPTEIDHLLQRTHQLLTKHPPTRQRLQQVLQTSNQLSKRIEHAVLSPRVAFLLHGIGPQVVREGRHKEITRIVPSTKKPFSGRHLAALVDVPSLPCGAHRTPQGQLLMVLCTGTANQKMKKPSEKPLLPTHKRPGNWGLLATKPQQSWGASLTVFWPDARNFAPSRKKRP